MQYLDENKTLILAILDNQNLGKLAECAQYQAKLQKNLMYLAAIADAQPQSPAIPTQMAPHPAMQQGGFFMQHPQAAAMNQQQGMFTAKMPLQFNNPQQMQDQQHQQLQRQQQGIPQQTGMQLGGLNSTLGGASNGSQLSTSGAGDARGGNKQDNPDAEPSGADGQASSVTGQGSEEPK
ncbi:GRF1-interacting factor 3 isoform X2 [Nicotiana tabacum]|uniref:GRF1-interacting factor 3 isoform X2 n=1 Tax=Nicotiana tabacum TaxID=4097 RepID=A0A1S3YJT8_TOBAC|nr:GRF1-interacting factor 3-like isoform X2 [Nicotiana tomentosiformis]XP_016452313.1 PREDICTED: GRF1-interacting factor 3-like isoform X2 [Nicotiana tabacum]XP_016452314.1 PREDICTED: GRF1-interacting factor 3-like isoform X2 [Nicotiana tabacum]